MRERYPLKRRDKWPLRTGDTAEGAIKREAAFVIAPVNGICLGAPRILGVSPQWADADDGVTSKSVIIRGSECGGGRSGEEAIQSTRVGRSGRGRGRAIHPCKTAADEGERG